MRHSLTLHPDSRCVAASAIDVEAARPRPGTLALRYVVSGGIANIRLPPVAEPAHTEGLWRHTCFEAFLRARAGPAYYEFNLSPSTQWAAYQFGGYRSGMAPIGGQAAPGIATQSGEGRFELRATLELDSFPDLPRDPVWCLGLSAVIEEVGGGISYWALAHPPGKADFHHSDCFTYELPAA